MYFKIIITTGYTSQNHNQGTGSSDFVRTNMQFTLHAGIKTIIVNDGDEQLQQSWEILSNDMGHFTSQDNPPLSSQVTQDTQQNIKLVTSKERMHFRHMASKLSIL